MILCFRFEKSSTFAKEKASWIVGAWAIVEHVLADFGVVKINL